MVTVAGDCKLDYDRATGCYVDRAQPGYNVSSSDMFSSFAQPSPDTITRSSPPGSGSSYDEVFQSSGVNGESHGKSELFDKAPAVTAASSQPVNGLSNGVNGAHRYQLTSELDHVHQRADLKPQPRQSRDELEFDDTDPQPGDQVQQFGRGRIMHPTAI